MQRLNKSITHAVDRPVKVMQFGEGNFLRAFVDYIFDVTNEKTDFNGGVVIVKPIEFGTLERFHDQECQYTLQLRGFENGQPKEITRQITSVVDAVAAIEDYDKFMKYGTSETLRFIVSNTTEAGIVFDETDDFNACPPKTYPGKLTKLLFERYKKFNGAADKGLILLPCELIADNGIELKKCIMKFIELWNLEDGFKDWVNTACSFCPTLVDRIVPGYPRDDAQKLCEEWGYEDQLIDRAETFGLWVVESDENLPLEQLEKELPFKEAGLNVVFTKDHHPYKERKVRILNGAHTCSVLGAFLAGHNLVGELMADKMFYKYLEDALNNEIIPAIVSPELTLEDLKGFADAVFDRFQNPFIKHKLLDISLNSTSKWEARVLHTINEYYAQKKELPKILTFSFAAYLAFYRGTEIREGALIGKRGDEEYLIKDAPEVLEFYKNAWTGVDVTDKAQVAELVTKVCANKDFWLGEDLNTELGNFPEVVADHLYNILNNGVVSEVEKVLA